MAKSRAALGTVPNRAEPFGIVPKSKVMAGRIPMKTDSELQAIAESLNQSLGRPPTAQELIEAAGGCQRQRALRAIQCLRVSLAEKAVRSQLVFPEPLKLALQEVMARWLHCAAEQMAAKQAAHDLDTENRLLAASDAVTEHAERYQSLQIRMSDLERLHTELEARASSLQCLLNQARADASRCEALAEERLRVMDVMLGKAVNA